MATTILRLGKVDKGKLPTNLADFLNPYHPSMAEKLKEKLKFRDEGTGVWRPFQEIQGNVIQELQKFLKKAGFMPKSSADGIYGYGTTAGVRLFQEYIRTIEGDKSIGTPDGVAGPNTFRFIEKWKKEKENTDDFVCKWGKANIDKPSDSYSHWLSLLDTGKKHYLANDNEILQHIENFPKKTDTRKIQDWNIDSKTIHLIGIRRNQDQAVQDNRKNDDLFVLLLKGMVFYFWGSTDPSSEFTNRKDLPFLIEGQHLYGFGWHKVNSQNRIYKALRPASTGVLVFRDQDKNQVLNEIDLVKGLDPAPNTTINIHWSGIGRTNFSAGCQVLAGASYINDQDQVVDCRKFAASSYSELDVRKTRGAYNVFADLILSYAPADTTTIAYTLARDETSFLSDQLTEDMIGDVIKRLAKK